MAFYQYKNNQDRLSSPMHILYMEKALPRATAPRAYIPVSLPEMLRAIHGQWHVFSLCRCGWEKVSSGNTGTVIRWIGHHVHCMQQINAVMEKYLRVSIDNIRCLWSLNNTSCTGPEHLNTPICPHLLNFLSDHLKKRNEDNKSTLLWHTHVISLQF